MIRQETIHRMTRRREGWDYCAPAAYMITLTLADRSRGWMGRLETREQAREFQGHGARELALGNPREQAREHHDRASAGEHHGRASAGKHHAAYRRGHGARELALGSFPLGVGAYR